MNLARLAAWLAGLLLAVLATTLLFAAIGEKCLLAPALVAILAYAVVAGLPTAAILWWRRWTHPLSAAAAGFVLGLVPASMFGWPALALLGAAGAAVFWATLRTCGALPGAASLRPRLSVALAGLAILVTVGAMDLLATIPSCGEASGR